MPIAVTADPGSEAKPEGGCVGRRGPGRKAGLVPSVLETGFEQAENLGYRVLQVIEHVPAFGGYLGFFDEDFSGTPEGFEGGLDLVAQASSFDRRVHSVFEFDEEEVEAPMECEDGPAFRLGRVGRKNGFNLCLTQGRGDGFGCASGLSEML